MIELLTIHQNEQSLLVWGLYLILIDFIYSLISRNFTKQDALRRAASIGVLYFLISTILIIIYQLFNVVKESVRSVY